MKLDGCFFDLDGTLCDTAPDILACWIATLEADGMETERFRRDFRIGPPLEPMIAGVFPDLTEAKRESLIASFRERYCTSGFPETVPYPEIPEMLEQLRRDRVRLFLVTNKALRATRLMIEKFGWLPVFEQIDTPDSTQDPLCGKPERLRRLLAETGLDPARCAMVGDTVPDIEAGRAAGMWSVAVTWGYGDAADLASASPDRIWKVTPDVRGAFS